MFNLSLILIATRILSNIFFPFFLFLLLLDTIPLRRVELVAPHCHSDYQCVLYNTRARAHTHTHTHSVDSASNVIHTHTHTHTHSADSAPDVLHHLAIRNQASSERVGLCRLAKRDREGETERGRDREGGGERENEIERD